jgi:hypothetical protein
VTWRPLGALLVEKGLLTAEELEEALAAQQTTGKRLGQILVDRGHVSGPALTNALAEQYGIELKTEEGFGTGLRAEIERRHSGRRPPVAPGGAPDGAPPAPVETETNGAIEEVFEHLAGDLPLAQLEPQLEEQWARLVAAEANVAAREARIAELEAELGALKRRRHESRPDGELDQLLAAARREAEERAQRLDEVTAERDEARRSLEVARTGAAELVQAVESAGEGAQRRIEAAEAAAREHERRAEQLAEQLAKHQASNGPAPQQAKGRAGAEALKREEKEMARRERELSKQLAQVEAEQNALAERAGDLRERQLAIEARAAELADHERELAEREQAMTGRQRAILTAAADLEQRRRSLEERERALLRHGAESSLDPGHEVVPSSTEVQEFAERQLAPPPERPSRENGYSWNLDTLTRLVEESADDFPDRVDDWRYTLFYLRNEARIDGALPSRFDSLVEECFGELVGTRSSMNDSRRRRYTNAL